MKKKRETKNTLHQIGQHKVHFVIYLGFIRCASKMNRIESQIERRMQWTCSLSRVHSKMHKFMLRLLQRYGTIQCKGMAILLCVRPSTRQPFGKWINSLARHARTTTARTYTYYIACTWAELIKLCERNETLSFWLPFIIPIAFQCISLFRKWELYKRTHLCEASRAAAK